MLALDGECQRSSFVSYDAAALARKNLGACLIRLLAIWKNSLVLLVDALEFSVTAIPQACPPALVSAWRLLLHATATSR